MGIEKQPVTFRLDAEHEAMIAEVGQHFEPPSANASMNLRTLLNGIRALLITGRMPRWMAEWQGVLRGQGVTAYTDSPTPEMAGRIGLSGVAGDAGRAALRNAKRPPRKISAPRTTDRAVSALAVQVDAWPAPFCGRGPFALLSRGV